MSNFGLDIFFPPGGALCMYVCMYACIHLSKSGIVAHTNITQINCAELGLLLQLYSHITHLEEGKTEIKTEIILQNTV